jgi:hypothetical protein
MPSDFRPLYLSFEDSSAEYSSEDSGEESGADSMELKPETK